MTHRWGLIAGNGRFPLLVLDSAKAMGLEMTVVAIHEETWPEIEQHTAKVHWIGLGQLGKLIRIFRSEGVSRALMAGQVQHKQIFSAIAPDWHLMKLLASLARKNTDSLIGAVANYLEEQGIELVDSTRLLTPLLAEPGVMSQRSPSSEEAQDIAFGLEAARQIVRLDIGQTVIVRDRAVIAVEAMEGTDATIRRAGGICGKPGFSVIKVSKPAQDMRFDVPVIGPQTLSTMKESGATAISVDAGRTLMLEKAGLLQMAREWEISIVGQEVVE